MSIISDTIRVAAAVADKKQVTLYLEDGSTMIIKQSDHRLGDLMDAIIPLTKDGGIAVISLRDFSVYSAFEKKTNGAVKFFKMAKSKIKGFFGSAPDEEDAPVKLSSETQQALTDAVDKINGNRTDPQATDTPKVTEAEPAPNTIESVIKHGTPVDVTDDVGPDEVVVAVVNNKAVVAGVQNLKPLIDHAVRTNSPGAVQAFLEKCAKMPSRQHSVDDLMRFLEKGDLPLTEDGSIIAYKLLNRVTYGPNKALGDYADVHSGRVFQSVGDYVCVDETLVDLNRRNDCSNGLHIARRGYLHGFSGNVCVLCKIEPEDVMVVPHNDANKVRVKGYHILAELTPEALRLLKQNKPMTGEEADLRVVYEAIKGNHIGRLREARIHGQKGDGLVHTKLRGGQKKVEFDDTVTGDDLAKAAALDDDKNVVNAGVSPREINKRLNDEYLAKQAPVDDTGIEPEDEGDDIPGTEDTIPENEEPRYHPAHIEDNQGVSSAPAPAVEPEKKGSAIDDLLLDWKTAPNGQPRIDAAKALVAFKKSKKKGWDKLGIKDALTVKAIEADAIATVAPPAVVEPAPKAEPKLRPARNKKTVKAASAPAKTAKASVKPAPASQATKPSTVAPKGGLSKAQQARDLFNSGDLNALRAFKKSAKKGWSVLGFSDAEIKKIEG